MRNNIFAALCALTSMVTPIYAQGQDFAKEYYLQSGLEYIGASHAWQYIESNGLQPGGRDRVIAILDDGLDRTHPELGKRVLTSNPVTGNHGNYVGAIAAAEWNGTGMVGVAPFANLVAANPGTKDEYKTLDGYKIDAFTIAMAAETEEEKAEFETILKYLFKKHSDAVFVVSGGQAGDAPKHGYPAAWAKEPWVGGRMIVVGALNLNAQNIFVLGSFKCNQEGQNLVDFCLFAPGYDKVYGALGKKYKIENDAALANGTESEYDATDIVTVGTPPNEFYLVEGGGTSAAAPFVSGAVAVIRAVHPDLPAKDVVQVLLKTSKMYSGAGDNPSVQPSNTFGWGILDLNAAVRRAIELKTAK